MYITSWAIYYNAFNKLLCITIYTFYNLHCTIYTLYNLHIIQFTLYNVHTVYTFNKNVLYTTYIEHTMQCIHCTMYNMRYTFHTVQCTQYKDIRFQSIVLYKGHVCAIKKHWFIHNKLQV